MAEKALAAAAKQRVEVVAEAVYWLISGLASAERPPQLALLEHFNATNEARVAMRHGRWKVLARLEGGTFPKMQNITTGRLESVQSARLTNFEIYDIEQDVAEANNLVNSDNPEIGELQKLLTASYRELVENSHVWTTVKDE